MTLEQDRSSTEDLRELYQALAGKGLHVFSVLHKPGSALSVATTRLTDEEALSKLSEKVISPTKRQVVKYINHGLVRLPLNTTTTVDYIINTSDLSGKSAPQEIWFRDLTPSGFTLVISNGRQMSPEKSEHSPIKPIQLDHERNLLGLYILLQFKQNPGKQIPFRLEIG